MRVFFEFYPMCPDNQSLSAPAVNAPVRCSTRLPLLNNIRLGIPLTPKRPACAWSVSVLTLAITKLSRSAPTFSNTGPIILHGPHHGAQKSTKTHSLSLTTDSNSASDTAIGVAIISPWSNAKG